MTWWYNFYAAWKCRQDWNDKESGNLQSHLFLYLTQGDSCFSYRLINTGFVLPTKNYLTGVVEQMNQGKPNEAMVSGQEVWLWFKHVWWYTGKYAIQMYLQMHLWKISDHMITCFYAGTPVECVVAPEDIFMNKMAHRPFRFLIVQQETVVLIKLRLC